MRTVILRLMWFVGGVVLALVLLELALRVMPVSKGLHRSTQFDRWPLQYMEPRFHYEYSIGWAMLNAHSGVSNNYGHVAPFDFRQHSRPVIVLGDSYIESVMNDYAETLQGHLGQKMGTPEGVYGLGVSGASASGYVALAQMARAEFSPVAAVVLITDGDLSESLIPVVGNHYVGISNGSLQLRYEPIPEVPLSTVLRKLIGDVSLHRYLQINLQFAPENIWEVFRKKTSAAPGSAAAGVPNVEAQRQVADWFLRTMAPGVGLPPQCVAILLDADRYAIYRAERASQPKDSPQARQFLIDEARQRGYMVQDLGPVFRRRYAQTKEKFDHWPIDRHWNTLGHRVAAEEAYRLLTAADGGAPACLAQRAGP